jgi:serine/threonine-protein kinase
VPRTHPIGSLSTPSDDTQRSSVNAKGAGDEAKTGPSSSAVPISVPRARKCPACNKCFSGEVRFCPFDGDALIDAPEYNPDADPMIGKIIDGRYEVMSVLGEGGMGTNYEVRHTHLGRRFALKVLRRDTRDPTLVTRYIQEAKAAAAIGHPNIVAFSDFGEIDPDGSAPVGLARIPYFVMELVSGTTLSKILRTGKKMAPDRAAAMVLQCASALGAAHDAGVVHRDLKPDNILIVKTGDREFVKLLDFGVAKIAGTGRLTLSGIVFGTPLYMSPEQAAGQPVDKRADIYALGAILYQCLTGSVPFEAETYMGVLQKHMRTAPDPIETDASDPPLVAALSPIVMRCLAKKPDDRYASMAELSEAVEGAVAAARREEDEKRASRASAVPMAAAGGSRALVWVVGVCGVVALAVLAWQALQPDPVLTSPPAPSAQPTAAVTSPATAATAVPAPSTAVTPPASATASAAPAASATPQDRATGTTSKSVPPTARSATGKSSGGGDIVDPWKR